MPGPAKSYQENNPAMIPKFIPLVRTVQDTGGRTRNETYYRPQPNTGYDILPDDILMTGNPDVLRKFQSENKAALNQPQNLPAKQYLQSRINTAEKLDMMEAAAKQQAAIGKKPPKPAVDNVDGFEGLSSIKYPDYQTSANGCWSLSYSMLLKSRGVDLSQEEIRQWRPDYRENTPADQKANPERIRVMNSDDGNSVYPNADLAMKLLPNTAMNSLRIEPFSDQQLTNNEQFTNDQRQALRNEYHASVKKLLQDNIRDALKVHQSPVSIAWDGHYVTITGISEDGNTIRYEDSLGADVGRPRTNTMSLDELVHQGTEAHYNNGQFFDHGQGFEMAWLSDVPQAQYGNPEKPEVSKAHNDYVKMEQDGSIHVDVPFGERGVAEAGSPVQGQIDGKAVEEMLEISQNRLSDTLKTNVEGWGPNGGMLFANKGTYYPKKTVQLGDPEPMRDFLKTQRKHVNAIQSVLNYIETNNWDTKDGKKAAKLKNVLRPLKSKNAPNNNTMEASKQGLKDTIDFLLKKDETGKTRLQRYTTHMYEPMRRQCMEGLSELNKALDLGKDMEAQEGLALNQQIEEEYQEELGQAQKTYHDQKVVKTAEAQVFHNWNTFISNLPYLSRPGQEHELMMNSLSKVAAYFSLHQQMKEQGVNPPVPSEEDVNALAPHFRDTDAFKKTTEMYKDWMFLPQSFKDKRAKNPDLQPTFEDYLPCMHNFVKEMADHERKLQEEVKDTARYAINPNRVALVQNRASQIADALDKTDTSYTGASRKSSLEYKRAKDAIRKWSQEETVTPTKTKRAVDTVMRYLDEKEGVRSSSYGKDRWNNCMNFLSQTMPRNTFESYCAHVNQKRGVGPESKDYVSPESFYPRYATVNSVMTETRNRIFRGEGTLRDFARIIAVRQVGYIYGQTDMNAKCGSSRQKALLTQNTEKILKDPRFEDYIKNMDRKTMTELVAGNASSFEVAWNAHKEVNPLEVKNEVNGPQGRMANNPQGRMVNNPQGRMLNNPQGQMVL